MKKFFISSMIVLLYVAYTSIMPVHAQNEVSVQKQNLYNSISDIADILLQHGADINKKSNGVAQLHFAAQVPQNEKPILLKYFLEKGADVNIRDFQGNTPLFVANFAANKEVTDLLLKFGADPTIRNNKGILYKDFKTGELYIFN